MKRLFVCLGVLVVLGALGVGCDGRRAGAEYCGNGYCESDESVATCPEDCSPVVAECGNGYCEAAETAESCPDDCEAGGNDPVCGNGYCEAGETEDSCPNDCASLSLLDDSCVPEDQRVICLLDGVGDGNADSAFVGPGGGLVGAAAAVLGDIDGDGYDDVLIGNPRADTGAYQSGAAYLLYGRPGGWGALSQLTDADAIFEGTRQDGTLGKAVSAAGDVNGDGYPDFLIGAPSNPAGPGGDGVVYLLFGGATRYEGTLTLSPGGAGTGTDNWQGEARFRDFLEPSGAGHALSAAGDVDGDGFGDFIIGAPGYDTKNANALGAAYLVYGPIDGSATTRDLGSEAVLLLNDVPDTIFAVSVSGGADMDGDGYDDFVIGHPEENGTGRDGTARLFYGGPARFAAQLSPGDADAVFGSPNADVPVLGAAVALVGDLDADGLADWVVGAPFGETHAGFLYYGSAERWSGPQDVLEADAILDGPIYSGNGPPIDTAGDINGDGYDDFLIHGNDTNSLGTDIDAVYLFLGGSARLQGTVSLTSAYAVFFVDPNSDDYCVGWTGSVVAGGGDVNGDGLDDFLIGAAGHCFGGPDNHGFVYLVLGSI